MNTKQVVAGHPGSPQEAFRQLVYSHAPGVADLALQMGLRPGTLYNKADADGESHHQPTLRDVVLATRLTGDLRVLDALEDAFGRAGFAVGDFSHCSDAALLELLAKVGAEHGEFHAALHFALLDKKFSAMELNKVRAEAFDAVGALMTLVARLEGLVDE